MQAAPKILLLPKLEALIIQSCNHFNLWTLEGVTHFHALVYSSILYKFEFLDLSLEGSIPPKYYRVSLIHVPVTSVPLRLLLVLACHS